MRYQGWIYVLLRIAHPPTSSHPFPLVGPLPQLLPVAPLYGDVQIKFADWVKHLPHCDPSRWTCISDQAEEKGTVAIQTRVETIRSEHVRFISELARYNNEVRGEGVLV